MAQLAETEPARRPALHQSPGLWPARSLRCAGKAKRTTRAWDTKIKTRKTADERRAEADTLHESISSQLEELTSTEGWARFLAFATGFHSYSLSNVLLILSQRPDASRVAGFRQWQERGRQVRKGERSIKIFGFATKRIEDDTDGEHSGEEERRAYFPILSVFDVSQTDSIDGEEIPDLAPRLIGGDDAGIYDAAAEWLTGQGWTIDRASTGEANGFTQHTSGRSPFTTSCSPPRRPRPCCTKQPMP